MRKEMVITVCEGLITSSQLPVMGFCDTDEPIFGKIEELLIKLEIAQNVTRIEEIRRCGKAIDYNVIYNAKPKVLTYWIISERDGSKCQLCDDEIKALYFKINHFSSDAFIKQVVIEV